MSDQPIIASPATPPSDWRAALPEDLKGDPSLTTIPDVPTLAKSYVATKAMTGRKAYDLPQPDWKPEQWANWNKTIGVPEAPDKYTPVPKETLEKAGLPPEVISAATAKMHEAGLTDRQAKALLDWYTGDTIKGREMQTKQQVEDRARGEAVLKEQFGDKYESRMGLLKAWMTQNATPEFAEAVEKAGLGNNPEFVKAIVKSAEKTIEDSSRSGMKPALGATANAAIAEQEIAELKVDKAFMERFLKGEKLAVQKWNDLHNLAASKYVTPPPVSISFP